MLKFSRVITDLTQRFETFREINQISDITLNASLASRDITFRRDWLRKLA